MMMIVTYMSFTFIRENILYCSFLKLFYFIGLNFKNLQRRRNIKEIFNFTPYFTWVRILVSSPKRSHRKTENFMRRNVVMCAPDEIFLGDRITEDEAGKAD
jgi:hypothetical protein